MLTHLSRKGFMTSGQFCAAFAVGRLKNGKLVPPAWLRQAINEMQAAGELEFSVLHQAYRLTTKGRQAIAKPAQSAPSFSFSYWEEQQRQRAEEAGSTKPVDLAKQPIPKRRKRKKPQPKQAETSVSAISRNAKRAIESKIRCLLRSGRGQPYSEARLGTVLGEAAIEVARQMPEVKRFEQNGEAFLQLKRRTA